MIWAVGLLPAFFVGRAVLDARGLRVSTGCDRMEFLSWEVWLPWISFLVLLAMCSVASLGSVLSRPSLSFLCAPCWTLRLAVAPEIELLHV